MTLLDKFPIIIQFFKFGVVGVINTAVDLIVLTVLIKIFPSGRKGRLYSLLKAISFIVANVNSYILNRSWTFAQDRGFKNTGVEFSQYFFVSIIGMLINVAVASFVNNSIHPRHPKLVKYWPQIAALFGTAFGLIWNFIGYKFLVF